MKSKVMMGDVTLGMFVRELDRPWLGTPFLFQGFLIEEENQIAELNRYCQFVYIDTEASVAIIPPKMKAEMFSSHVLDERPTSNHAASAVFTIFEEKINPVYSDSETGRWMSTLRTRYALQSAVEEELPIAKKLYTTASVAADSIFKDAITTGVLSPEKLHESMENVTASVIRNPDAMLLLSYLKKKSSYAYDHAVSVSIHLLAFGRHIGLDQNQLQLLGSVGLLLDVGMVRLPEVVLQKGGQLSSVEQKFMRRHVQFGVEIIQASNGFSAQIADIVAQHHERENGSGYPLGLTSQDILPFAKMAAIVDCFTALVSERSYAKPLTAMAALNMLHSWRNDYYQADLVEQFIQCLGPYPVGSFVEMNTGEVGVVLAHNRVRRLKPKVMLVLDADKKPYLAPVMLDLISNPKAGNSIYEIHSSVPEGVYQMDLQDFYL